MQTFGGEIDRSAPAESARRGAQFESVVEHAPDPFARFDREHRYLYANSAAERLLGLDQRAEGKTNAELGLVADWLAVLDARLRDVITSGAPECFEFDHPSEAGLSRYDARLVPERGASGGTESVLFYAHDVSVHTQPTRVDEEGGRVKDEFLAGLSHEIRNPLMPIRSSLYVLERAAPGGEQARRALSVIHRQVNQLTRLVDDLLDVARVTRNTLQLQRERIEFGALLDAVVQEERPAFDAAGVELRREPSHEPLWVNGDPARMKQVTHHLLQNAAKLASRGGRVTVRVGREGTMAVLRVHHTGATLPPEVMARLFQPFADAGGTLEPGVLGLGLALARQLTELHGGTVTASNEPPQGGAELALRLPLLIAPPGALLSMPNGEASPRRVLVIEDNRDAATSLREALELMGYEVAVANDGPQGLELARSFDPAVVLCDIGLPGMDGYDVARAFRADERLSRAVLVALTGHALPEDQRRAVEAGFTHHIAKPLSFEALERLLA